MSYQSTLGLLHYPEIFMILVVVLIMFGAKKLPELARGLGQGIKEFKNATSEIRNDIEHSIDAPVAPRRDSADHH
jgi:sec-independent protein translocase protein TatA